MFDSIQNGLRSALKTISGKAKLTEANMREGLKIVEQALLEADVSYSVVQDFMQKVTAQALGEKVLLNLRPDQVLVEIVHQELVNVLGPKEDPIRIKAGTNVFMMCGLQGSGKTTSCGKLATLLLKQKLKPMLVAADLQRPAAIEQLHVLGRQLNVPVYSEPGAQDPVKVCQNAVAKARKEEINVVILDTAGRLAIDKELMDQLVRIDRQVQPDTALLVVDGMTGQDAVNSAKAFHEALELDGVIMTKLDGDARGGALLSVKHVTGVPIKFIGTGEQLDALEPFRPEGMAGRILGMGDIVELVRKTQDLVSEKERESLEAKMAAGNFDLEDFRDQIDRLAKPGIIQSMLSLLPGMGALKEVMGNADTAKETRRIIGMIDSMTPYERKNPNTIEISRRQRIAKGAGVQPQEVNELIKRFEGMRDMMNMLKGGGNVSDRIEMMKRMQQQMMDPNSRMRPKGSTGKRLTNEEKAKQKKLRDKMLKDKMRNRRNREG